jgi:hypothetical protein
MIRSLSYLPGKIERIEVARTEEEMSQKIEMLVSYGFDTRLEEHCGFFLLHWSFPKPPLSVVPKK